MIGFQTSLRRKEGICFEKGKYIKQQKAKRRRMAASSAPSAYVSFKASGQQFEVEAKYSLVRPIGEWSFVCPFSVGGFGRERRMFMLLIDISSPLPKNTKDYCLSHILDLCIADSRVYDIGPSSEYDFVDIEITLFDSMTIISSFKN